jgi:hypothetical protein
VIPHRLCGQNGFSSALFGGCCSLHKEMMFTLAAHYESVPFIKRLDWIVFENFKAHR